MSLSDAMNNDTTRANLVADCAQLIDEQVAAKKGLGGMALKAAYGVVKGIGPSYLSGAIERLLPDILTAIEPMWNEGIATGDPVAFLSDRQSQSADQVLSVTDRRIENSSNSIIRSTYGQLRKSIKGDVEQAIPGLAKILSTHAT